MKKILLILLLLLSSQALMHLIINNVLIGCILGVAACGFILSTLRLKNVFSLKFILWCVVGYCFVCLMTYLCGYFQTEPNDMQFKMLAKTIPPWSFIFMTSVLAPIFEETIFRQLIWTLFDNEYVSLVVSSLLFVLIHIPKSPVQALPYLGMGLYLGVLRLYFKNVAASLLAHSVLNNIASFVYVFH